MSLLYLSYQAFWIFILCEHALIQNYNWLKYWKPIENLLGLQQVSNIPTIGTTENNITFFSAKKSLCQATATADWNWLKYWKPIENLLGFQWVYQHFNSSNSWNTRAFKINDYARLGSVLSVFIERVFLFFIFCKFEQTNT